jgi:FAD/FMN-containing dehydrogenase
MRALIFFLVLAVSEVFPCRIGDYYAGLNLVREGSDATKRLGHCIPTAGNSAATKMQLPYVDLSELTNVLDVDEEHMTITVEACCTMGDLLHHSLALGLIPQVLPEIRTMTIGGAIVGASLEASSVGDTL